MRSVGAVLFAVSLTMGEAVAAESPALPRAPSGYRVANGLAIGGVGLIGLSVAGMAAVSATCTDTRHGCVYSYLVLTMLGVAPGMALQPVAGALGVRSLRRNGHQPHPWGLYTMAAGASLLATVPVTNAVEAYSVGTGLAVAGLGLLAVGGVGQLVTNVVHFETRSAAQVSLRPWVNREQAGLALAARW